MAAKVYGNKSHVAFVAETVLNTAVTPPTRFIELVEAESISYSREKTFVPTGNTRSVQHQVNGKESTGGSVKTFLTFNGDELLLVEHAMGLGATTGPTDTTAYTHTFTLKEALPVGLTMYADRNSAVYGKEFQYPGSMLKSMTISQPLGQVATIGFEMLGSGDQNEVTATAATFPAIRIADWTKLTTPGVLTLNGSAIPCDNIEIKLENTLAEDIYIFGSTQRDDLKADGERVVTMTFSTFIVASDPVYLLFTGDTAFAAVATWKGATVVGAATTKESISVSAPQCKITAFPSPAGGSGGPIKGQVTIRAYASATLNDEFSMVYINADSSY